MAQIRIARTVLAHALGLALLGVAGGLQAQEAPQGQASAQQQPGAAQGQAAPPGQKKGAARPNAKTVTQLGAVNVTGSYRNSIEFSTEAKRDATNVIDTVYAEDIGKFPDTNIAESLSRVPGVQISRDADGEGMNIQVRGLGTDFTKILLNGDQVAVASSGSLDAQNQNREVDLDLLPSEFFTQLSVNKTPMASMTEGGVAGVVDMRTTRPFDNPGTHLTYSAQGSYSSIGKDTKPRGSLIGSWTNDAGTFGVLAGLTGSRSDYDVRGYETIGWTTPHLTAAQCGGSASCSPAGGSWVIPSTVPAGAGAGLTAGETIDNAWLLAHNPGLTTQQIANALIPRLGRDAYIQGSNDHQSGLLSFEFRPSERAHFYLDTLFSKQQRNFNRLDMDLVGRSGQMIPVNMQVDPNDVVTSATLANAQYFLEARPYRERVNFYNLNPGGELLFGDDENVKLDFQGYVQRSWYKNQQPSMLVSTPMGQGTTVNYSNGGGEFPDTAATNADLNDPNLGWTWYRLNVQNETRVTSNKGSREDLQIGGDDNNIRVGVAYDDITRQIKAYDNSAAWQAAAEAAVPNSALPSYLVPGPGGFISVDYAALMAATNYGYYNANAPLTTSAATGANTADIQERTWAHSRYSDEGDGLGRALEAATTSYRNDASTGWVSAELASETIALIGAATHDGWKMYTDMRDNVANILGSYGPDLMRIASTTRDGKYTELDDLVNSSNPGFPPVGDGGMYGMNFDKEMLTRVLETIGEDDDDTCSEESCARHNNERECCTPYRAQATTLDRAHIASVTAGLKAKAHDCGTADGLVRVSVHVRPDGSVDKALVLEAPESGIGSCVAQVLRDASFPATADGGAFVYRIDL